MRESSVERKAVRRKGARDLAAIAAGAMTLAITGAAGAAMSAVLPPLASPWLAVSGYAAAAGLAFTVYWWIAQKA